MENKNIYDVHTSQFYFDDPDSGFFSANFPVESTDRNLCEGIRESAELRSQLQCLKNSLRVRWKCLVENQELSKNFEEELEKTKRSLSCLQKKYEKESHRNKPVTCASQSEPGLHNHYETLNSAVNKVEEALFSLSQKHSCGLNECQCIIEQEMEKIHSIKQELKVFESNSIKSKSQICGPAKSTQFGNDVCQRNEDCHSSEELPESKCSLVHLYDVEMFREKAVSAVATLEEMKEQIDILEGLIAKYIEEFPCECDKSKLNCSEKKFERLRGEFYDITNQLCCVIQKMNQSKADETYNNSTASSLDIMKCREQQSLNKASTSLLSEDICKLRAESQRLQREICDQENEIGKLKRKSREIDEEILEKQKQLIQRNCQLDSQMCEITRIKDLVAEITEILQGSQNVAIVNISNTESLENSITSLKSFFCTLEGFQCMLKKSREIFMELPRLREENKQLNEKVQCLEKRIYNKEETLKSLQDSIKLRECKIEELKVRMQSSETEANKLTQDVEEKCRLIANLQEAVRKCKQFESNVRSVQIHSLKFKICELSTRLGNSEMEICSKEKKLENLQEKILELSSKNYFLNQELGVLEPRLQSMYKTCHLFEKLVCDLQQELKARECEIGGLREKIKDLEEELDREFKNSECHAAENSKGIECLSQAVKNFQQELCTTKENYDLSLAEAEERLLKEREMSEERETELKIKICRLKAENKFLQNELQEKSVNNFNDSKVSDLQCTLKEAECRQQDSDKKIAELETTLKCTMRERSEERKVLLDKLGQEKKENVKNKTLITKLNENIKKSAANEKFLQQYIDQFKEEIEILKEENSELKAEIEVRKKFMNSIERNEESNLSDLEGIICCLKMQKSDIKSRCYNLKVELDKEIKLRNILESRVKELNLIMKCKVQEFNEIVKNYKLMSSRLEEALMKMKVTDDESFSTENARNCNTDISEELNEDSYRKDFSDVKSTENAKLFSNLLVTKIELESLRSEYLTSETQKDYMISNLRYEATCLENKVGDLQEKCDRMEEENEKSQEEINCWMNKVSDMQAEFEEKQKELCAKLRATTCEKNELLISVDQLQKQLEQICLENVNQEKMNRELVEECSRLKVNKDVNDDYARNKSGILICNLNKEVRNLQCELCNVKQNYNALNEEYQDILEQLRSSEKKKLNLEKLYLQVNNEKGDLQELKTKMEKELCELKTQNTLLKEKIMSANKGENSGNCDDKKAMRNKIRELTLQIKTLEQRVIPNMEQEIAEKNCCIENLKVDLREANISSQRMRNEALRVIQHTKKYLAAQRCVNESLKSRLECSNKRGSALGAEKRDLEEQLKAVTQMNEFLLCELESSKNDTMDAEPCSHSPLPWSCTTVERDTSSSEYFAESGIQSMQQSPTNLDFAVYDCKQDSKRPNQNWNSLKRTKCTGSAEYSSCRGSIR